MNRAKSLFIEKDEYQEFLEYAYLSNYGEREIFYESIFSTRLRDKIEFVKDLAKSTGKGISEIFKLFIQKPVFNFFQSIGWSIKKLFEIIKKGWKAYTQIYDIIGKWISENKITQFTRDNLKKLDNFLKTHPILKRITGVVVAGILIYVWTTMSFTGHLIQDFDLVDAWNALLGKFSLSDLFTSPVGSKMLFLFLTGSTLGLSFPWPGTLSVKFIVAIINSLYLLFKNKIKFTKDSPENFGIS